MLPFNGFFFSSSYILKSTAAPCLSRSLWPFIIYMIPLFNVLLTHTPFEMSLWLFSLIIPVFKWCFTQSKSRKKTISMSDIIERQFGWNSFHSVSNWSRPGEIFMFPHFLLVYCPSCPLSILTVMRHVWSKRRKEWKEKHGTLPKIRQWGHHSIEEGATDYGVNSELGQTSNRSNTRRTVCSFSPCPPMLLLL